MVSVVHPSSPFQQPSRSAPPPIRTNSITSEEDSNTDDEIVKSQGVPNTPTFADSPFEAVETGTEEEKQAKVKELLLEKIVKCGWLEKKGERRKKWKNRWFVLRTTKLTYYKDDKEYIPLGVLSMNDVHSISHVEYKNRENVIAIVTKPRTYYLETYTRTEMLEWINALQDVKKNLSVVANEVGNSSTDVTKSSIDSLRGESQTESQVQNLPVQTPVAEPNLAIEIPKPRHRLANVISAISESPEDNISAVNSEGSSAPNWNPLARQHSFEGIDSPSDDDDDECCDTAVIVNNTPPSGKLAQQAGAGDILSAIPPGAVDIKNGWLLKQGRSKVKSWKKRWFVLRGDNLTMYKDEREYEPLRLINLSTVVDVLTQDPPKSLISYINHHFSNSPRSASFSTSPPSPSPVSAASSNTPHVKSASTGHGQHNFLHDNQPHCFQIVTPKRTYLFSAETKEDMVNWILGLRKCVKTAKGER